MGCYEAKKSDFPNCVDYEKAGFNCVGEQCVLDHCVGDFSACSKFYPGKTADTSTGTCVDASSTPAGEAGKPPAKKTGSCFYADKKSFPDCKDYEKAGYTCVGDDCVVGHCIGECNTCAKDFPGQTPDPATGKCVNA